MNLAGNYMNLNRRLAELPKSIRSLCARFAGLRMDEVTLAEQFLYDLRLQKLSSDPAKARRELAQHDERTGDLLRLTAS